MTMWSMLLFWIPVCIGIVAFFTLSNTLEQISSSCYLFTYSIFIVQIVKYTYIESQEIFIFMW